MIRASGADDDVAPCPRLLFRKLRFLVIVDTVGSPIVSDRARTASAARFRPDRRRAGIDSHLMSLLLRRIHLYLALFLAPWILMYAVSTFVMNHRRLFHGPPPEPPPQYEVERELVYPGEMPEGATPQQVALQLLATLDLDGAHAVARPFTAERVVVNRQDAISPRRITYTAADKKVRVEKMIFSGAGFFERMHRRRGYQHNYVLDDLWAISVDVTIVALILLALSGIWMWWELRVTRRLGALALGAGIGLFCLLAAVL